MSYVNLVYGPAHHKSFVAQWLEHPTSVWKVIGSIPVGDSGFFFVPCSWHVDHIISQVCSVFWFSSSLTAVSPSSLPVLSQYKTCPQHHALVLALSSVLQTIAICCPGALIWNSIPSGGGSASNSSNSAVGSADAAGNKPAVLGSPLDRLPIAPSQMPLPSSANAQGFLNSEVVYVTGQN